MTTTTTNKQQAAAWAFVLSHVRQIDSAAWAVVQGTCLEYDDGRSELIAYIVENHCKFNPERGWGARTWIRMQARKVRRAMVRAGVRNDRETYDADDIPSPTDIGSLEALERRVEVDALLRNVTEAQRIACLSVLQGWDARTVRAHTGGSTRQRDRALASIGG